MRWDARRDADDYDWLHAGDLVWLDADDWDPDYDLDLCQPGEPARDVVTVEIPGVSQ